MAKDVDVDREGLTSLISTLRGGAQELDGAAKSFPTNVDAGVSSHLFGSAMGAIAKGAGAIMVSSEQHANSIHEADGSYANVEETNKARATSILDELQSRVPPK